MIKINFLVFMISLFIGFFMVYISSPKPIIIIKYPTLNNVDTTIYIDEKDKCYKYIPKPVDCSN